MIIINTGRVFKKKLLWRGEGGNLAAPSGSQNTTICPQTPAVGCCGLQTTTIYPQTPVAGYCGFQTTTVYPQTPVAGYCGFQTTTVYPQTPVAGYCGFQTTTIYPQTPVAGYCGCQTTTIYPQSPLLGNSDACFAHCQELHSEKGVTHALGAGAPRVPRNLHTRFHFTRFGGSSAGSFWLEALTQIHRQTHLYLQDLSL